MGSWPVVPQSPCQLETGGQPEITGLNTLRAWRSPNSESLRRGFGICREAGVNAGVAVGVGVGKLSSPAPAATPASASPDDLSHGVHRLL